MITEGENKENKRGIRSRLMITTVLKSACLVSLRLRYGKDRVLYFLVFLLLFPGLVYPVPPLVLAC